MYTYAVAEGGVKNSIAITAQDARTRRLAITKRRPQKAQRGCHQRNVATQTCEREILMSVGKHYFRGSFFLA